MTRNLLGFLCCCVLALCLQARPGYGQETAFAREVVDLLGAGPGPGPGPGPVEVGGRPIYSADLLRDLYQANAYRPLWGAVSVQALARALDGLVDDGLAPQDHRFPELAGQLQAPALAALSGRRAVEVDVLLSEAFLRAAYQLYFGKVDPQRLDPNINFLRVEPGERVVSRLLGAIREGLIDEVFDWARPQGPAYRRLVAGLRLYRNYAEAGGWPMLPPGPTLRVGDVDAGVPVLRARLAVTGDLAGGSEEGDAAAGQRFDAELARAVRGFQRRHGLDVDGAVGPATRAALNVPVARRIDQIRVNLERLRWILHEAYDEYLAVDIAGFQAYWIDQGVVKWQAQVQVGSEYTQTPVFAGTMTYLDFNPTWTIPPGIMRRTVIPSVKRNPDYLRERGYQLLTLDGREVDPSTIDFASLKGFPFMVRQPPGPDNALGQVKFMFPNPHFVFLHDTNHRELFDRTRRTFSSGCIRVRDPFVLAETLLSRQGWDRERIDRLVASGKTTRVPLEKPLRIFIAYFTARVPPAQQGVHFREDVYGRDAAVLDALDGPFLPRPPAPGAS
jgi:murein L,D-transpeptidase YcbB/YkuD